jgi:hypothetical protein
MKLAPSLRLPLRLQLPLACHSSMRITHILNRPRPLSPLHGGESKFYKLTVLFRWISNPLKRRNPLLRRGFQNGAGEETRTLDVHLGKVVLYQLSYARKSEGGSDCPPTPPSTSFEVQAVAPRLALCSARALPRGLLGVIGISLRVVTIILTRTPGHLREHGAYDGGL